MRIIIAGGRDFNDYEKLDWECSQILFPPDENDPIEIVSGCARGADQLGQNFAKCLSIPIKFFPANWDLYGKSAGYRRNIEMGEYVKDNGMLVAFWDGKSKGTKHMIDIAKERNIKTFVIKY